MKKIAWIESYERGLSMARTEQKLAFADFFNPN